MKAKVFRGSFSRGLVLKTSQRQSSIKDATQRPIARRTRSKAGSFDREVKKSVAKSQKKAGKFSGARKVVKKATRLKRLVKAEKVVKTSAVRRKAPIKKANSEPLTKPSHSERKLKPRPNLTSFEKNPFFECKTLQPAFVSVSNYSKWAIRAVLTDDEVLLKSLIADKNYVHSMHVKQSIDCPLDALTYALIKNKPKMIKLLSSDLQNPLLNRVALPESLLSKQNTGQYNFRMLGRAVRAIQMSRGGREGTNAFLKDQNEFSQLSWQQRIEIAIERGVEMNILQCLVADGTFSRCGVMLSNLVYIAARAGRCQLTGLLVRDYALENFNELAHQVLLNKNEALKPFKAVSIKKKGFGNKNITPLHLACINPNVKYLRELLAVDADLNCVDSDDYKPIHYAAVNQSGAALRHLLQMGASPFDVTKRAGRTALHLACEIGRAENVGVLCGAVSAASTSRDDADEVVSSVATYVRRKTRDEGGLSAAHLAARRGHVDVLRALLKYAGALVGGDKNRSAASSNSMTPLMFAAKHGHLDAVRLLRNEAGASLDARDKLRRTPLMLSAMNGHAHVTSYLLREGVDPDLADSSGNTASHYAAAYGWYFVMDLLIEAGADLSKSSDWLLTPLSVAYMKGHVGLADLIIKQPNVDINCKDSAGMSLVALTISSGIDETTSDQLLYLLEQKKANVNLTDAQSSNPLHHLASCAVRVSKDDFEDDAEREKREAELRVEIARILIKFGCESNKSNYDSQTPFSLSVLNGHLELASYLLLNAQTDLGVLLARGNETSIDFLNPIELKIELFHWLAAHSHKPSALQLFRAIAPKFHQQTCQFLSSVDKSGYTPLLFACRHYKSLSDAVERENCRKFILALILHSPKIVLQTVERKRREPIDKPSEGVISEDNSYHDDDDDRTFELSDGDKNDNESKLADETLDDAYDIENIQRNVALLREVNAPNPLFCRDSVLHLLIGVKEDNQNQPDSADGNKPLLLIILETYKAEHTRWALDRKFNNFIDWLDQKGQTALYKAAVDDDVSAAELLLNFGASAEFRYRMLQEEDNKIDPLSTPNDVTVLTRAVLSSNVEFVELILKQGVDVNAKDAAGRTPLHHASMMTTSAASRLVRLLIKRGADASRVDVLNRTPLHYACDTHAGGADDDVESLEALLNAGADPYARDNAGRLPMHYVFSKSSRPYDHSFFDPVAVITTLHRYMAKNSTDYGCLDLSGRTVLHLASQRGANICCIVMISFCGRFPGCLEVEKQDCNGNTALGLAVQYGHYACSLTLLQNGCKWTQSVTVRKKCINREEYEKMNEWRWKPIRAPYVDRTVTDCAALVVRHNWPGMLYLMTQHSDGDPATNLKSLINAALSERKYALSKTLIRQFDATFGRKSSLPSLGSYFLRILVETSTDETPVVVEVAESLCNRFSVEFEAMDDIETTNLLCLAAKQHNFALFTYLETKIRCKFGELKSATDGHTALSSFFHRISPWTESRLNWLGELAKRHSLSLNILAEYDSPVDFTNSKLIGDATKSVVEKVTPLIRAIWAQDFSLVKFMLKSQLADVNFPDFCGRTPLMHAIMINNTNIFKLLLDFDYNMTENAEENPPEMENNEDYTPPAPNFSAFGLGGLKRPRANANFTRNKRQRTPSMVKSRTNEMFLRKSSVNLMATDTKNRNAFDYLVSPLPVPGAWENDQILRILNENGARCLDSVRTMHFPFKSGQRRLCDELRRICPSALSKALIVEDEPFWTEDDYRASDALECSIKKLEINLESDFAEFWRQWNCRRVTSQGRTNKEQKIEKPYHLSEMSENAEIAMDSATNRLLSVLISKMECAGSGGVYGYYNFYRMQLLREKGREIYVLFTNWGRMGDSAGGQFQKTSFKDFSDAYKEFCKIFRSKTSNDWPRLARLEDFEPHDKKYRLLLTECSNQDISAFDDIELGSENLTQSKCLLPASIQNLMKDLADFNNLKRSAANAFRSGRSNHPLVVSSLRKEQILDAQNVLIQLMDCVTSLVKARDDLSRATSGQRDALIKRCISIMEENCALSCQFYRFLPLKGFEHSDVTLIDDAATIRRYASLIDNLLNFECAVKVLCASYQRATNGHPSIHPLDYAYKSLGCRILPMSADDPITQHILHYVHNSRPRGLHVTSVYKVLNPTMDDKFAKNLTAKLLANRRLLWHGTGSDNLLGILTHGLAPAPFHADQTGQLFGPGIYAADTFGKSVNYCKPAASGTFYMLLCEVALGNCMRVGDIDGSYEKALKGDFDSVQGVGRKLPDPNYDLTLPTGTIIPLGCLIDAKRTKDVECMWLQLNEFIVYDPKQIIIRYVVSFKKT